MSGRHPVTGDAVWAGAGLVALATITGMWTIKQLVAPGPWVWIAGLVVLLLAGVTATLRWYSRSATMPTAWGLVAAVVTIASVYGGRGTTPSIPLPTPETFDRLVRLARSGVEAIAEGRILVEPTRGVELLVVAGTMAVFLVADLVALGLGRGGLSGVALAGLWVPAAVFERRPILGVLLLGGISYLLLLTVTRQQTGHGARDLRRDARPVLTVAVAVTVLAVLVGPVAAAMPFYGAVRLPATWGPGPLDGPLRLSTDLDMRSSLEPRSDRPVLTYNTSAENVGPLRMYTLVDFDGTSWLPSEPSRDLAQNIGVLWPDEGRVVPADADVISVRVGALDQDHLPIPLEPRLIEIDGTWLYDAERDEVVAPSTTTRDRTYLLTIAPRDLTAETLREDGPGDRFTDTAAQLTVPQTEHMADIRALAEQITADAGTTYDQALALQMYLRDAQLFRYDTDVPPAQSDDAVWDFLTQRTGYCVQYATAMTVMARTLGIPARLAIGFLPGRLNTQVRGEYVVSGRQAHAWPELYFADAGWVRFEPTPAVQTGSPPLYADPFGGLPVNQDDIPTGNAQQSSSPGVTGNAGAGGGAADQSLWGRFSLPVLITAGVLLVALLGLGLALTRRREHPLAIESRPDAWWAELRTRLAVHGLTWSDATTPRQAVLIVRERIGPDATAALDALDHLMAAVENERYEPRRGTWSGDELEAWVDAVERPLRDAAEADAAVTSGER
ncbi:DUF3488 and transglutaminase-like domain-containing protein [Cellulomonas sp. KRMCY2]|uniref:transglutaminase family protein n=1 Tax=Cellulomonas sp. KRMCY2 TaxID=1304865 RepID=UPI00045E6652|nr:DUF3488 and transglutaminase-like domain-containing protein [Cellulomonas sp. KRMCY2]